MSWYEEYYPESKFGGFSEVDCTIAFYKRVNALIQHDYVILDYGCGRGSYQDDKVKFRRELQIMKGKCQKVIGVDIDDIGYKNPFLDEFYKLDDKRIPINDHSIDICICDWVLEHIEKPEELFHEFKRIIKPGGYLCIRTVNKWNYISIFARIIPNKMHKKILSFAQPNRDEEDIFPTYYRCNSLFSIRKMLSSISNNYIAYSYESEPAYLNFSKFIFGIGVFFHKISIPFFKHIIFGFCKL